MGGSIRKIRKKDIGEVWVWIERGEDREWRDRDRESERESGGFGIMTRMHSPPFRSSCCFIVASAATRTPGAADGQGGTCKSFDFESELYQCHLV